MLLMFYIGVINQAPRHVLKSQIRLCTAERGGLKGLPLENLISIYILIKLYTCHRTPPQGPPQESPVLSHTFYVQFTSATRRYITSLHFRPLRSIAQRLVDSSNIYILQLLPPSYDNLTPCFKLLKTFIREKHNWKKDTRIAKRPIKSLPKTYQKLPKLTYKFSCNFTFKPLYWSAINYECYK